MGILETMSQGFRTAGGKSCPSGKGAHGAAHDKGTLVCNSGTTQGVYLQSSKPKFGGVLTADLRQHAMRGALLGSKLISPSIYCLLKLNNNPRHWKTNYPNEQFQSLCHRRLRSWRNQSLS